MLVSRDGGRRVNSRRELARLRRAAEETPRSREGALGLLIQIGEFESAILDAVTPDRDGINQTTAAARVLTEDAALEWLTLSDGKDEKRGKSVLVRRLTQFEALRLPIAIELPASPEAAQLLETCAASARRVTGEGGIGRIHAIGIRDIGAVLSAVVTAAIRRAGGTASSCTVRLHDGPLDRALRIDSTLVDHWRQEAALGAWFVILGGDDPGPSGAPFDAIVTSLDALQIPASRIVRGVSGLSRLSPGN